MEGRVRKTGLFSDTATVDRTVGGHIGGVDNLTQTCQVAKWTGLVDSLCTGGDGDAEAE